ncbi:5-oxoprolinase [Oleiphilus sp. HI0071]|jgi:N-methylhydantoinase B|uniref:hydantoinase B/oxoprolinase family protein n=2 Tax=Oleiphilus TaxID=141450 RepID=UPI0007C3DFB2|nr:MULTISPECIES: hydantoinase B/oxoprolinase family protein [unclassified Oleiphilus]KZY70161.1 5-oxoprolinase [Oleiphilus sp. HI0065]KZY83371.1 5-oxoprolinase [Oleiphilus sp. HI0071]KZY91042.1 5-oxoprolinase [Oleiphilus sp. HI0073]KZZ42064.1 5-oxoprolinase [Oleiphilus sp. HI0118]KZZ60488.1 5-oxoprolinase [Oleiphilus sp. HI0122]KZZ71208.1 5-oxoprolinase [Oleiphilus sp. HI0130]KZZ81867.1 5-oxoprolinase [Oleiphilus sp. HI0133]
MIESEAVSGVELAIFLGKLNAVCDEMGYVLQRSAFSPNIKDRLDFSCAVFDREGAILAQAAHIPVHLGSMAYAMRSLVAQFDWQQGDMVVVNDPFQGGTHLPDVTMIAPMFIHGELSGFVVNRAHHANIGASAPGSMPLSSALEEEGVILPPKKLLESGQLNEELASQIRGIDPECSGALPEDFVAQISANKTGLMRLEAILVIQDEPIDFFDRMNAALHQYGAQLMKRLISQIPEGVAHFEDVLDGDGFHDNPIRLKLQLQRSGEELLFDFKGSSAQVTGNLNCPLSVSAASVYYVIACMLPEYAPKCDGVFRHIRMNAVQGSILNANPGSAVAAGNVETSMRVVDLVQGAFAKLGLDMPAASQGTMNNIAMGSSGGVHRRRWDYYETLGGGMGAHAHGDGLDAVQCHMTNTLNTPVESLELHYPLRIDQYGLRCQSGGAGERRGGDGLKRSYTFLEPTSVTLLTDRRVSRPWGINAASGKSGENYLNGVRISSKRALEVFAGDTITIETPGGGGWSPVE